MRTDYSYIGSGRILARRRALVGSAFFELGNCSALSLAVETETKTLRDSRSPGGGTYNRVDRITGVNLSITAHDLSPQNLSLALYGTTSAVTAAAITDELAIGVKGQYVGLKGQPASITSVSPSPTGTAYVAGTDYEFRNGQLFILPGGTVAAPSGSTPNLKVTYQQKKGDLVQALITAAPELEFLFMGLNEADSGSAVQVRIWRGKLGPAANLPLIGDEYAGLEMTGAVLADSSQPTGVSQYFQTFVEDTTA